RSRQINRQDKVLTQRLTDGKSRRWDKSRGRRQKAEVVTRETTSRLVQDRQVRQQSIIPQRNAGKSCIRDSREQSGKG
ncbi:hypothetical protein LDENG_00180840, partial [Lucifuga dentata]